MDEDANRPNVVLQALTRPNDIASLAAFRVLFGVVMCASALRAIASGWVEQFYLRPSFHFKYWGFEWVEVLPAPAMYAAFVMLAVLSLLIALGLFYRVAIVLFLVLFTYVELIDVTWYLNHYYLVTLLSLLMAFLPLHRAWSLDARRRPASRATTLPAWMSWLLRFQVGTVYVYAALAKVGPDWLLHGQPLQIWLSARTDAPLVGPWLDQLPVALALGWAGFFHDLLIVPMLLCKRTRPWAYVGAIVFHGATGYLFNIGMFPFIMIAVDTIFFPPDWPRTWIRRLGGRPTPPASPSKASVRTPSWVPWAVTAYCAVQVLVPLRFLLYEGNVLWGEQGMRWAWKVMVREKNGSVTYDVRDPSSGRTWQVPPSRYLTDDQEREMSGQPDLILQLAHHIAADFEKRGYPDVEVRTRALVSLNGRAPRSLVDPSVDLARVEDGIAQADWILPPPEGPPVTLAPASERITGSFTEELR